LNRYRKRQQRLRARLQAKKTSSARRLLTKRRRKEARFAAHLNHQISKRIAAEAQRTGRGIAVEQQTVSFSVSAIRQLTEGLCW
jgi:putative transposase